MSCQLLCFRLLSEVNVMKLGRIKRRRNRAATRNFESELALEILKSDKMRITILICALGAIVPVTLTMRPQLTRDEINANAETYRTQIFKLLDHAKTEMRFNSEWMDTSVRRSSLYLIDGHCQLK